MRRKLQEFIDDTWYVIVTTAKGVWLLFVVCCMLVFVSVCLLYVFGLLLRFFN